MDESWLISKTLNYQDLQNIVAFENDEGMLMNIEGELIENEEEFDKYIKFEEYQNFLNKFEEYFKQNQIELLNNEKDILKYFYENEIKCLKYIYIFYKDKQKQKHLLIKVLDYLLISLFRMNSSIIEKTQEIENKFSLINEEYYTGEKNLDLSPETYKSKIKKVFQNENIPHFLLRRGIKILKEIQKYYEKNFLDLENENENENEEKINENFDYDNNIKESSNQENIFDIIKQFYSQEKKPFLEDYDLELIQYFFIIFVYVVKKINNNEGINQINNNLDILEKHFRFKLKEKLSELDYSDEGIEITFQYYIRENFENKKNLFPFIIASFCYILFELKNMNNRIEIFTELVILFINNIKYFDFSGILNTFLNQVEKIEDYYNIFQIKNESNKKKKVINRYKVDNNFEENQNFKLYEKENNIFENNFDYYDKNKSENNNNINNNILINNNNNIINNYYIINNNNNNNENKIEKKERKLQNFKLFHCKDIIAVMKGCKDNMIKRRFESLVEEEEEIESKEKSNLLLNILNWAKAKFKMVDDKKNTIEKKLRLYPLNKEIKGNIITIFISGFYSSDSEKEKEWENFTNVYLKYFPNSNIYYYNWPSSNLNIFDFVSELLIHRGEFERATKRAECCGRILGNLIQSKLFFDDFKINLVAFSLGNHVIKNCLKELYEQKIFNVINNIIFIAGATNISQDEDFIKIFNHCSGNIINCYSKRDLALVYRFSIDLNLAIGRHKLIIKGCDNIYNYKSSNLHLLYRKNMGKICKDIIKNLKNNN